VRKLPNLPPDTPSVPDGIDASMAVDLENIDCRGCTHRSIQGACRRMPPQFVPPVPVPDQATQRLTWTQGGWTFPPAVQRCGEYRSRA
jgi:hypothetical protein